MPADTGAAVRLRLVAERSIENGAPRSGACLLAGRDLSVGNVSDQERQQMETRLNRSDVDVLSFRTAHWQGHEYESSLHDVLDAGCGPLWLRPRSAGRTGEQ